MNEKLIELQDQCTSGWRRRATGSAEKMKIFDYFLIGKSSMLLRQSFSEIVADFGCCGRKESLLICLFLLDMISK